MSMASDELSMAKMPAQKTRFAMLGASAGSAEPVPEPAVVVRNDFRSTVLWQPEIVTDKNGNATVKVKYPDSLTTWRATARAVSDANQFGIADTDTQTKQPLIVRLEAPRFLWSAIRSRSQPW